jgi:hypothetical protein
MALGQNATLIYQVEHFVKRAPPLSSYSLGCVPAQFKVQLMILISMFNY